MPQYRFNVKGEGHTFPDHEGHWLSDVVAARQYAIEAIRDRARQSLYGVRDWGEWTIEVLDEAGDPVASVPIVEPVESATAH